MKRRTQASLRPRPKKQGLYCTVPLKTPSQGGYRIDLDVEILDTTLRDGAQTHGVSFTLQDKLSIAERLDELGVRYIEGGWPGSNPKDLEFFRAAKQLSLKNSEIVAFGSTRKKGVAPEEDAVLNSLLATDVKSLVIFGKSWDLHVRRVLRTTLEENLRMIKESVEYLKAHGFKVIYDAEHFFDGYRHNPLYATSTVKAAEEAGADVVVLCDTNGGSLTKSLQRTVRKVKGELKAPLGIHCHNDSGLAVANTLVAVEEGTKHLHGTINGLGERCGNADLCQILPSLCLKMKLRALRSERGLEEQLKGLRALSQYVYQLTNVPPDPYQPYVGSGAFAHKGGVHIDAMLKEGEAYEHIDPALVGSVRKLVVSELSGRASVVRVASEIGLDLSKRGGVVERVLEQIKLMEAQGYQFENAEASVQLMILREVGYPLQPFKVRFWRASTVKEASTEAVGEVMVDVNSETYHETSKGVGPVHALDLALRRALLKRFPQLKGVSLVNYKVTVVDSVRGTASSVRVFIEFEDGGVRWATTAVSTNILEASSVALTDGYTYRLMLNKDGGRLVAPKELREL